MDVAGEKAEPSFYQRIPQLLGRTATGESSKADPSHILWCVKKRQQHQYKTLQKEDRYPLKEIQKFSGTGKKICANLN